MSRRMFFGLLAQQMLIWFGVSVQISLSVKQHHELDPRVQLKVLPSVAHGTVSIQHVPWLMSSQQYCLPVALSVAHADVGLHLNGVLHEGQTLLVAAPVNIQFLKATAISSARAVARVERYPCSMSFNGCRRVRRSNVAMVSKGR